VSLTEDPPQSEPLQRQRPAVVESRRIDPPDVVKTGSPIPVIPVSAKRALTGFELQSPSAGDLLADTYVPQNSWFCLASGPECDAGTCKVVPVSQTDRKLNTALQWELTPDQAATKAGSEGKLVFLIHVSGNFAQPGFT
jgi:hypothetical protein